MDIGNSYGCREQLWMSVVIIMSVVSYVAVVT